MLRDDDFGIVRARAFGTYDFKIVDPKLFLKEVAGSDQNFRLDEFADTMRSRIVSVFSDALASAKIPVLDVASRYTELGEALLPLINPVVSSKYGIQIASFIVENVSVPPEVEAGDRQEVEHGGHRQPQRLREVPDGQGHGAARRRRRGRHGQPSSRSASPSRSRSCSSSNMGNLQVPGAARCAAAGAAGAAACGGVRLALPDCCRRPTSPRRSACPKPT